MNKPIRDVRCFRPKVWNSILGASRTPVQFKLSQFVSITVTAREAPLPVLPSEGKAMQAIRNRR